MLHYYAIQGNDPEMTLSWEDDIKLDHTSVGRAGQD
jgi:hypothetical protein